MRVVFITSPYTLGDVAVNVRNQLDTADKLMNLGICPIVPLLSHFQHLHRPRPYEHWMEIDFEKIRRSDALLRLPGESKGSEREIKFAKEIEKPVFYSISEVKEWNTQNS